jgi:hypothetical protein
LGFTDASLAFISNLQQRLVQSTARPYAETAAKNTHSPPQTIAPKNKGKDAREQTDRASDSSRSKQSLHEPKTLRIVDTKPTAKQQRQKSNTKKTLDSAPVTGDAAMDSTGVCECLATIHPLYTNCLNCGKILCQRESPGPCTFCHNPVDIPAHLVQALKDQDRQRRLKQTRKGTPVAGPTYRGKLHGNGIVHADQTLTPVHQVDPSAFPTLPIDAPVPQSTHVDDALRDAQDRKNRLLEYDRTDAMRSHIHGPILRRY